MDLLIILALIIGTVLITAGIMLLIFWWYVQRQSQNITEQIFSTLNAARFEEMIKRD